MAQIQEQTKQKYKLVTSMLKETPRPTQGKIQEAVRKKLNFGISKSTIGKWAREMDGDQPQPSPKPNSKPGTKQILQQLFEAMKLESVVELHIVDGKATMCRETTHELGA